MENHVPTYQLGGRVYEVIKPKRLCEGQVLKSGDTYARIGPKTAVIEEQAHTVSLFERGFPVPRVIESGPHGTDEWYFVEQSVGDEPFHKKFVKETRDSGKVSNATYRAYLQVMDKYLDAQMSSKNRTTISAPEFVNSLVKKEAVLSNYCYFGFSAEPYGRAIDKATERLADAAMGVLQYDLNPYNILAGGVIDFELVGYGPVGYDVLMSSRWGGTWFTNYPSRYPVGYALSPEQIAMNDTLVKSKAHAAGLPDPTGYMEEFLLLKTAWGVMEFDAPQPDWPPDKLAFRRFRANLLDRAVQCYLRGEAIDYWDFPNVPGGEIES